MREELTSRREPRNELVLQLGNPPQRIPTSGNPQRSSAEFVQHQVPSAFAGRSYRMWRNDPALAKIVNDTLAERTDKKT